MINSTSKNCLVILILLSISHLLFPPTVSITFGSPDWETYNFSSCGITLQHPYQSDIIKQSSGNSLEVESNREAADPDSIDMTIKSTCILKPILITGQMFNLTLSSLKNSFASITHEESIFNRTDADGALVNYISVVGYKENSNQLNGNSILTTTKNNMTNIIKLNSTGDDGISGFANNYKYLEENILGSINITR